VRVRRQRRAAGKRVVHATKESVTLDLDLPDAGGGGYYGVVDRCFLWTLVDAKGVEAGSSDIRVSRVYPAVNGAGVAARLESRINLISTKRSMKNQRDKLKVYQRKVGRYGWSQTGVR